jgi:hypothetical protein
LSVLRGLLEDPVPRPHSLRPDLDADLEAIILRCLHKRPEDRYPDVPRLLADLESYLGGRPLAADRPTLAGRMGRWVQTWWRRTRTPG